MLSCHTISVAHYRLLTVMNIKVKMIKRILLLLVSGIVIISSSGCGGDGNQTSGKASDTDVINAEIENDLGNAGLYFQRAQMHYDAKAYDKAITDLDKAIQLDSLKPEYYHLLSDTYMDYYRSKDALVVMMRAATRFPKRIPTLLKLSETQLILKMNEVSLETVAKIFSIDPDHPEGHFMKGMNFRAMGETDRAINAFQTATELNPEMVDAWLIAGDLFFEKGLPIAIDYYDAALRIDPENTSALHSKAYYLQNNGRDNEAIQLYKEINVIDKKYLDAYLNAGILYMTMDSLEVAKEQFNIMASLKPTYHLPYYYRGLIHEAQGDIEAARKDLQNSINLDSEFSKAKQALGRIKESQ